MAQRTYCKAEILRIIENQEWKHWECTGNTGITTIFVSHKDDSAGFGRFTNYDNKGEDCYTFELSVNAY